MPSHPFVRSLACLAGLLVAFTHAGYASATWSILLVDLKTGEIAVGSATCLTGFDLQQNTPVLIPGLGAATAQSLVDGNGFNRTLIRDALLDGLEPDAIVEDLALFDPIHETRQYGIVRIDAPAATFTGSEAGAWAGGVTGVLTDAGASGGDIAYAIQGNVLTGEPVVIGALAAIEAEPGDLPDKLMAGMLAARLLGGDGRCSCSNAAPTACGPTPEVFEKSADIAYMLVARAGDTEGCAPSYRLPIDPRAIEVVSDSAGTAVVVSQGEEASLTVFDRLDEGAGGRLVLRTPLAVPEPIGGMVSGDVTGDGLTDLVVSGADGTGVWLLPRNPDGTFMPAVAIDAQAQVDAITAVRFGTDPSTALAVADTQGNQISLFESVDGSLAPTGTIEIAAPRLLASADVLPEPGTELIVASGDPATLTVLTRDVDGALALAASVPTDRPTPSRLAAIDIDGDGTDEVLLAEAFDRAVSVYTPNGPYAFQPTLNLSTTVRDLRTVHDTNGTQRLLVLTSSALHVYEPSDLFIPILSQVSQSSVELAPERVVLLEPSSEPDIALMSVSRRTLRLVAAEDAAYPLTAGCGNGDFFLEFNVALAQRSDPDPVDQLLEQFDAWSASLVGVPDAVRSSASLGKPAIEATPGCGTELLVRVQDRSGNPVDADSVDVTTTADGTNPVAIGAVERLGPGAFRIDLESTGVIGTAELAVDVLDQGDAVRLMPAARIETRQAADLDGNGSATPADYELWLEAFAIGDPAADQNADGRVNSSDFFAFVVNYNGGCG